MRLQVPSWKEKAAYPAALHLIAYGLAIACPLILMLGTLLFQTASYEREQSREQIIRVLATLTDTLDRDLDRQLTILQTLATSSALQKQDWPTFYSEAQAALQGRAYVVLVDVSGRQIVNTYVPHGQEPPMTGDPETVRRIAETKGSIISNLFTSLVVKKPVVNVSIPILQDNELRFVLSLGFLPSDLAALLKDQKLDPEWVSLIWDTHDVVLARSRANEDYVGRLLPEHMRANDDEQSVVRTANLDGEDVLYATARSRISGWGTGVNVPVRLLESRSHISYWLGAASLLAAILAVGLGVLLARELTQPLSEASAAATALGRGEALTVSRSRLREANTFSTALERAQQELAAREAAEKILVRELQHRTNNLLTIVQAIIQMSLSGLTSFDEAKIALESRLQALARVHRELTSSNWDTISLEKIVRSTLEPFPGRISTSGPDVRLSAKHAQNFSLAMHELATNAAKYGALSTPIGVINVSWTLTGCNGATVLNFKWQERNGPQVAAPQRRGFGTSLLQATFTDIKLDYSSAGLTCDIKLPIEESDASPVSPGPNL